MIAKLNALRIELDIGDKQYYYDDSYCGDSLSKAQEIYSEYGLVLPETDFKLFDSGCQNYIADFEDEDGKSYFHTFYMKNKNNCELDMLNRADCEGKFLLCSDNVYALEHLLTSIGSDPSFVSDIEPGLIPLVCSMAVYKRDFYQNKIDDLLFMTELRINGGKEFYSAAKQAKKLVFN
jgi:hypothetical protein